MRSYVLPGKEACRDEHKESTHPAGTMGNFGEKQVCVLVCATANIDSAWARGPPPPSKSFSDPVSWNEQLGTDAVIFIAELHGVTPSLPRPLRIPPALAASPNPGTKSSAMP